MPLYVHNLTAAAITTAAGNPPRSIPPSSAPPARGPAVNMTTEFEGLSGGDFALLDAQRIAGDLDFIWTSREEFSTPGLTVVPSVSSTHASTHFTAASDALVISNSSAVDVGSTLATNVRERRVGFDYYRAPRAASVNYILAASPISNGETVMGPTNQPDYPRKLQVEVVSAAAPNDFLSGTLMIVGVGASGEAVSDTFNLAVGAGVTTTYTSYHAYAQISKLVVFNCTYGAGGGAGSTASIGQAANLAIPANRPASTAMVKSNVQKMIVPAYFPPGYAFDGWGGAGWTKMIATPEIGMIVFNPATGPGGPADELVYRADLTAARAAGKKVVGYTYTGYYPTGSGPIVARPLANVLADIDNYFTNYVSGVDGIFLDEVRSYNEQTDPTNWALLRDYFTAIYNRVKSYGASKQVVLNPGSVVDFSCLDWSDIIVNYENFEANYPDYSPPLWQYSVPAERNALILHTSAGTTTMQEAVRRAKGQNFGWCYITNAIYPALWSDIPTDPFLSTEQSIIADATITARPLSINYAFAAADAGYVYLGMHHSKVDPVNMANTFRRAYFDTDMDTDTGVIFGPVGADYLVENNSRFDPASRTTWHFLGGANVISDSNNHIVWRISRADLGNATGPIKVMMQVIEFFGASRNQTVGPFTIAADALPTSASPGTVFKANVGFANATITSQQSETGTLVMAAAPDGSNIYQFWSTHDVTPQQSSHLHAQAQHSHNIT